MSWPAYLTGAAVTLCVLAILPTHETRPALSGPDDLNLLLVGGEVRYRVDEGEMRGPFDRVFLPGPQTPGQGRVTLTQLGGNPQAVEVLRGRVESLGWVLA